MSETRRSPGPWEVVAHPAYPSFKILRGPSFSVSVVMGATDLTFEDYLRRDADLQLMAAAPDLLEALQALLPDAKDAAAFNDKQGFHDIAAERKARISAAVAAITKATGAQS